MRFSKEQLEQLTGIVKRAGQKYGSLNAAYRIFGKINDEIRADIDNLDSADPVPETPAPDFEPIIDGCCALCGALIDGDPSEGQSHEEPDSKDPIPEVVSDAETES